MKRYNSLSLSLKQVINLRSHPKLHRCSLRWADSQKTNSWM